eukprot:353051-Chlamydomonas_euryale.AAC.2
MVQIELTQRGQRRDDVRHAAERVERRVERAEGGERGKRSRQRWDAVEGDVKEAQRGDLGVAGAWVGGTCCVWQGRGWEARAVCGCACMCACVRAHVRARA